MDEIIKCPYRICFLNSFTSPKMALTWHIFTSAEEPHHWYNCSVHALSILNVLRLFYLFPNAFKVFRAYTFKYYLRISVMCTVDVVTLAVTKLKLQSKFNTLVIFLYQCQTLM